MKLNKANNDGSMSVCISKKIGTELGWEAGQEIDLIQINDVYMLIRNNKLLVDRDGALPNKIETIEEVMNKVECLSHQLEDLYARIDLMKSQLEHMDMLTSVDDILTENIMRRSLKTTLVDLLDRI